MVQSAIQGQDNRTAWFVVTLHETQYSVPKTLSIQSMEAVESIPQPSRVFDLTQTLDFGTRFLNRGRLPPPSESANCFYGVLMTPDEGQGLLESRDARSSALTRRIKSSVASCWLSRRFDFLVQVKVLRRLVIQEGKP